MNSTSIIFISMILYMLGYVLNYSMALAHLQRSHGILEADSPPRVSKDMKYSLLMAVPSIIVSLPLFLYIINHSKRRFTGFMILPTKTSEYWKLMALKEQETKRHHEAVRRQLAESNRKFDSMAGRHGGYVTMTSEPRRSQPKSKLNVAANPTDGRSKSIWGD